MEVVLVIVACLIFFAGKGIYDRKNAERRLRTRVIREYGSKADRKLDEGRAQSVAYYCRSKARSSCPVDDITWNDLDMDSVYYLLNSCKSSVGDEYLYYLLRNPIDDIDALKERNRVINALSKDEKLRTETGFFIGMLGSIKNISVYEYICRLKNVEIDSSAKHILQALLLAAAIGVIFFEPVVGIFATIAMFSVNIISYFRRKSQIECYFSIFSYILLMAGAAKNIKKVKDADVNGELKEYTGRIESSSAKLRNLTRGAEFFLNPMGAGDLLQSILDYLRMAFHVDLIAFNLMLRRFYDRQEVFDELFENVGFLDCMLAAASYREWTGDTCEPILIGSAEAAEKPDAGMSFEGLAHPLIEDPVVNSLKTAKPVLLTGSNASGKSTFLKAIAINAILAQSIYTARAENYEARCYHVMSSMALQDNLFSGESYYIVEIRSLKRILDEFANAAGAPVLAFIDEVLRGTNTVERIAASCEILKALSESGGLTFAATHDIELTYRLEGTYSNYHFEEEVSENGHENEVTFDYKLRDGRSTTRNAIKLLSMLGFDRKIVEAAQKSAESLQNGTI